MGGGDPDKIIVRIPNWVGDVVMATPALRSLRAGFPETELVLLGKPHLFPILHGAPWHDRVIPFRPDGSFYPWRLGRRLREEHFQLALVLPNSFSSALVMWAAKIPRRVGYNLDLRGILLTDPLPVKKQGRLRPIPMVNYYLKLCHHVGCPEAGRHLELPSSFESKARAERFFEREGLGEAKLIIALNPGAAFGPSKLWPCDYFAEVADYFMENHGARIVLLSGPDDREICFEIESLMRGPPVNTAHSIIPLQDLVAYLRRCSLLITTDSGPRHFGVAAGIPVVVVMGPTHPAYTEVEYDRYTVLLEKVDCWPCHRKRCPKDHRCMTRLLPEKVIAAAEALLEKCSGPGEE
jgi:heptosyltransferase-2